MFQPCGTSTSAVPYKTSTFSTAANYDPTPCRGSSRAPTPTNPLMRLSVGEGLAPPETFPIHAFETRSRSHP